jgi:uroporphyrinogen-III synthase
MKVVVTGTDARVAERLRADGFDIVVYPLVRIEPLDGPPVLAGDYDWVVLTSRNAVDALFRRLDGPLPAGRVLFAGAEDARDVLVRALDADFLPLYRTLEVRPDAPPDGDLVVLASASAARAFAATGSQLPCVSIGPVTSAEARRRGLTVVAEADSHDLEGLIRAVKLAGLRAGSSRS